MVTVITKTIGPTGRDYTTFTLAEADVTNIGTSADLVANDEAIVFEADAGTYTGGLNASSTLVTDATRNVTYKPAAGSEHGGSAGAGVIIDTGGSGRPVTLSDDFTVVDGFNLATTTTYSAWLEGEGVVTRNCVASPANRGFLVYAGTAANPIQVLNCVSMGGSGHAFFVLGGGPHGGDAHARIVNCTGSSTGNDAFRTQATVSGTSATAEYINCVALSTYTHQTVGSFATATGSNNVGGAFNRWPVGTRLNGLFYTLTTSFSTPLGSGDYAVYMGATGALADVTGNDVWQQGVGPGSNSDVPTTDINGVARSGASCNPGAFEADGFVAPTVITKTIGPSGRDYATFTLAEAAVTSIGSGTDLTFENEAIVFEADAGTYDEQLVANSTLTTDATRNVTYQPAAGSEHGGAADAGVILYRNAAGQDGTRLQDDYTTLRGLNLYQGNATAGRSPLFVFANGCVVDQCILTSLGGSSIGVQLHGSSSAASFTLQNSVVDVTYIGVLAYSGYAHSLTALNVTTSASITSRAFAFNDTQAGEFVNCLVLGPQAITTAGTVTLSGSNNFGPSGNAFPAALQGSPYPITAVTDPEQPAAGDYAIHDAQGRLYDTSRNDVLQAGVGPSANSDVPTTDITGEARSGATCNPGAFEATVVLSISTPAAGALNNSPDFRVHLDRRVTDASFGVSAVYDSASDSTTFTLPYRLNAYARMQVVTRKTSGANAGELLSVTATDANAGTVTVAGNHTSTAVFIGETYIMKYEFSTPHLQAQQRMSPTKGASHRIRYGTVTFADTSFFEVKVKPKGGDAYTYTFNGNLLNEPETLLGQVAVYDGDFKFPVMADHDRATVTLENDSPLPSRFLGCEWEAFYHSRIGQRSRF